MNVWMDRLADVDDDYLIGLSNKGIVKRAYKDKEETAAEIISTEAEAVIKVGGETVTVLYPLGESKCTCPSRSICRHVVLAILVLKEYCLKQEAPGKDSGQATDAQGNQTEQKEKTAGSTAVMEGAQKEGEAATRQNEASAKEATRAMLKQEVVPQQNRKGLEAGTEQEGIPTEKNGILPEKAEPGTDEALMKKAAPKEAEAVSERDKDTIQQTASEQNAAGTKKGAVWREINEYPLDKLKKALGSRSFASFVNQVAAGIRPKMQYSSVVTVQLPDQSFTVKLLSPLEYSSCTCHKKELCIHKAAAILWCQLETKTLTKESLLGEMGDEASYDMAQIKEAAGQMRDFLEELLGTGLSRTSPDVLDYLERLAIISHNVGLARFEGYFRALSDSYDGYFARKASFRAEDLTGRITRLYRRTRLLQQAQETAQISKLAGEFRADYLPVGNLELTGVTMEHFKSQTGYEGDTVYFLEENTGKWYTYTNARPVFYDGKKNRNYMEKSQAPWGINLSFENLLKVRIRLTGAKCDGRRRLSSSQETKGEILGESELLVSNIGGWYYRDFGKLFSEQIGRQQREWLSEQEETGTEEAQTGAELVFVQPESCVKAEFSRTGQMLSMPLYDKMGREIIVEVTYSKQEADTIRYLERLSEKEPPCFLGKIYLRDGKLRMYPVDLPKVRDDFGEAPGSHSEEDSNKSLQENKNLMSGGMSPYKSKYQVMEELSGEIQGLMEELFQSGFSTVHESTLQGIGKATALTAQYGMDYLSSLLSELAREMEKSRHQMEKSLSAMTEAYTNIDEYLYLCRQKTAYDRGAENYR